MQGERMNERKPKYTGIILVTILTLAIGSFAIPPAHTQGPPTITLLPPAAPPGTPITVSGTDFTPGATVDLYWFGYIVDIPGIKGSLGYYPIKTSITVNTDGSFVTTIIAPYDFTDVPHFVNATQNGIGVGITNTTFTIVPILKLSTQPPKFAEGQEVILHVYGGPLGTPAFMMGFSEHGPQVIKFTYDNTFWGFATSHLETEGPIVTQDGVAGDVGGNITIRFKAVGGVGKHNIRAFIGGKETSPYISCEVGGEVNFEVEGESGTSLGTLDTTVTSLNDDVATIQTDLGNLALSISELEGSTESGDNYVFAALALSIINLIVLLAVATRVFRKT